MKDKKQSWVVKDTDAEVYIVVADDFDVGLDGLTFYLDGNVVAHFLRWANYRKQSKVAQKSENKQKDIFE